MIINPTRRREMKMKAQMKAIMASAVVIALCLAAVGGVTYSWFSDSEEVTIDTTTAIVNMDVTFGTPSTNSTITTIENEAGTFKITNLAANFEGKLSVEVKNKSTIKTVYRQTIVIEESSLLTYDAQNITIDGKTLYDMGLRTGMTTLEYNGAWTNLNASTDTANGQSILSKTIEISTPTTYGDADDHDSSWNADSSRSFKFTIKYEMYQGDYVTTSTSTIASNTATTSLVDSTGTTNVSVNFNAEDSNDGDKVIISKETDNAGFKIGDNTTISLDYETSTGEEKTDFNNAVTITVIIPGDVSGSDVVYLGTDGKAQPTSVSSTYDSNTNTTTVTFSTTHFSKFIIGKVTAVSDAAGLTEAINNGGYVRLEGNIESSITIPAGKNVILDLNGKTLSSNTDHTITIQNGATLYVLDTQTNGAVDCTKHARAAVNNEGVAFLLGGKYTRSLENGQNKDQSGDNSFYTVLNNGKMVMSNINVMNNGQFSSLMNIGRDVTGSSLTINGNTSISGGLNAIKVEPKSFLTIDNATVENIAQYVVMNYGTAVINGGTFNSTGSDKVCIGVIGQSFSQASENNTAGKVIVNGGTFTGAHLAKASYWNVQGSDYIGGSNPNYTSEEIVILDQTTNLNDTFYSIIFNDSVTFNKTGSS